MKITMLGSGSYKSSLSIRLIALAKELARNGHIVTVIVPSADKYNNYTIDRVAMVPGVHLVQPWQLKTRIAVLNLLPYLFTCVACVLRSRPDMMYVYKPTPITMPGLMPRLFTATPLILDLDDLGSEVMRGQGQAGLMVKLVALSERLTLRYANSVVVTSTYLCSLVTTAYPSKPVAKISNGIDPNVYTVMTHAALQPSLYFFGYLNRLNLIEDVLHALPRVIAAIPKVQLTVVGEGSALQAAKDLTKELHIQKHVTYTGYADPVKAASYANYGDLGICYQPDIPTVRAASNMKVFQYMALGIIPVVSDVGDLAEYVGNGEAGVVVQPNDSDQLAGELIKYLKNTKIRRKIAERSVIRVRQHYTWEHLGEQLNDFILSQSGPRNTVVSEL